MAINKKLGMKADHRRAVLRNLATALIDKGKITTTLDRAKELRGVVEKMITTSKENSLCAKRKCLSFLTSEPVVYKLFNEVSGKYKERNGGYTRIVRLGTRRGDCAEMAVIELV